MWVKSWKERIENKHIQEHLDVALVNNTLKKTYLRLTHIGQMYRLEIALASKSV